MLTNNGGCVKIASVASEQQVPLKNNLKKLKKYLTNRFACDIIKKSAARGMTLQEKTPENPVEKNSKNA